VASESRLNMLFTLLTRNYECQINLRGLHKGLDVPVCLDSGFNHLLSYLIFASDGVENTVIQLLL